MKKNQKWILALLCVSILGMARAPGHSSSGRKPDWVDGKSGQYPAELYLTGVGMGDDRASAEDRARAQIAKVFESVITVRSEVSASESDSTAANGRSASSFSQSVRQNVQTATKKALEGVEIADAWQDPATREHYALATLDRQKAIASLTERISDFDTQIVDFKKQLDGATEKLARVKAAMKILTLLKAREELNSQLRVLEQSGKGAPSPIDAAAVKTTAQKALSELAVIVTISGDASNQIETGLIQGLGAPGLQAKIGTPTDGTDIVVEGRVATNSMEGDGSAWRWARASITVSLKDGRTGQVFSQFDSFDREASHDYSEAVRRAQVELSKKLAARVGTAISSYFADQ